VPNHAAARRRTSDSAYLLELGASASVMEAFVLVVVVGAVLLLAFALMDALTHSCSPLGTLLLIQPPH
jgi:hypothetical protein